METERDPGGGEGAPGEVSAEGSRSTGTEDRELSPELVAPTSLPATSVEPGVASCSLGPASASGVSVSATLIAPGWELPRLPLPEEGAPLTGAQDMGPNPRSVDNMVDGDGGREGVSSFSYTESFIPEASVA